MPAVEEQKELSAAKKALLEKWKRGGFRQELIPKRRSQGPAPASFPQRRLWFLDQMVPASPAYNIPFPILLQGPLQAEWLRRSLAGVVARHEVLRTTFRAVEGEPMQFISPALQISLPVVDLTGLEGRSRQAEAERLVREDAERPFDLRRGPLLRLLLLRLQGRRHILALNVHHIVFDGWSSGILLRELWTLYLSFAQSRPSPMPELPIQYADYACWQQERLQGEELERNLSFWKRQLADALPVLELPTDHPRPAVQRFQGRQIEFAISAELGEELFRLSRRQGATSFMTFLTAFLVLLHRYSEQNDISLGTPIANRNRAELEDLIGFFVNTLVFRTRLEPAMTFSSLLQRVRETSLAAFAHPEVPFEKLVEELKMPRDTSRNPLFQVMFVLQNAPPAALRDLPAGLSASVLEAENSSAKFDLWLSLFELPEGAVRCVLEYNSDIFDGSTARRMARHYLALLESACHDPGRSFERLDMLGKPEAHQLLAECNDTAVDYRLEGTLHQAIEAQVRRTPAAAAAAFEDSWLSFASLDRQASRLSARLLQSGARSDAPVGLYAERSLEMVTALLAILKAGAAYLPLDPSYPSERIAVMLTDAGAPLLLAQTHLEKSLPQHSTALLRLEAGPQPPADPTPVPPTAPAGLDSLAYVIFTSGSTGRPKGVAVAHRGILNRLLWMQQAYRLDPRDRVLQKTPFSFDVSVWEFFWPWMTGACLVLARPEGHKDAGYLADCIRRQRITTLHFVPSMLEAFLEHPDMGGLDSIRLLVCSGEALPPAVSRRCLDSLPGQLENLYGPTEASVDVTYWACRGRPTMRSIPIGRPVANTRIHLLDRQMGTVPIGVPGELHIAGVQLARGYLERPALTAQRFVPDPYGLTPGERLYKTGDRARRLPDGAIEFLGRIDFQVKLRGFRIELGEIEAAMRRHPGVGEAAVQVRGGESGARQLVGYLVQRPEWTAAETHRASESSSRQVLEWEAVFDESFSRPAQGSDPEFNIVSWNSSYTGEPLAEKEMREQVDQAVERILDRRPRDVLEIGCGTGLLLFPIAPRCRRFHGTDISHTALDYLRPRLVSLPQVSLELKAAHDFEGIAQHSFDTVVLNSVVQYFPSLDYLLQVLEKAVDACAAGGFVYLGDLRSLPLLQAFHTSVELFKSADSLPVARLRQIVRKRVRQERELLVDPAFFQALKSRLPRISSVEVLLKRGRCHNELTRFRYDALLHVDSPDSSTVEAKLLDGAGLTLEQIRELVNGESVRRLGLSGLANARLQGEIQALQALSAPFCPETVGELRQALQSESAQASAIDPEDMWRLGEEAGLRVSISWSSTDPGSFDVIFERAEADSPPPPAAFPEANLREGRNWAEYANNPQQDRLERRLLQELRQSLQERLPEFMVPSNWVVLPRFPLSANGKLDRKVLPAPESALPELEEGFAPPRTPAEKLLAEIWAEVLNLERVGIRNSFFELGGDSIHSIQLVSRAQRAGLAITPAQVFQHPTIAELAQLAGTDDGRQAAQESFALTLPQLQRLVRGDPPILIESPTEMGVLESAQALGRLAARHQALRLRFFRDEQGRRQRTANSLTPSRADLSRLDPPAQSRVWQSAALQLRMSCPTDAGPACRALLIEAAPAKARLLLLLSPLAADRASVSILLEDWEEICGLSTGARRPAPPSDAYQQWSQRFEAQADPAEVRLWQHQAERISDKARVEAAPTQTEIHSVELSRDESRFLVQQALQPYRSRIQELILTALTGAWQRTLQQPSLLVELEDDGRGIGGRGFDCSRIVGCLSRRYRVSLESDPEKPAGLRIQSVKEQLRKAADARQELQPNESAEPHLSYRHSSENGDFTAVYGGSNQIGLDVAGRLSEGRLRLEWRSVRREAFPIQRLAENWLREMRLLLEHCRSPEAGGSTPSDFPLAGLDQAALDRLPRRGRDIEDIYPATPMQTDMLDELLHSPQPGLYSLYTSLEFQSPEFDVRAFENTWRELAGRHAILRTAFLWEGLARPLQVVYKRSELRLRLIDLTKLDPARQKQCIKHYIESTRMRGYDLRRQPQTRLALFRTGADSYQFVYHFNNMLQEGWSFPLITADLFHCYSAYRQSRRPRLPARRPYRDYLAWIERQDASRADAFWKRMLDGFCGPTPLIRDRFPGRPRHEWHGYSRRFTTLSVAASTALRSLCRRRRLTLNTVFQGAWALLLSRYSGRDDVLFGVILSGRSPEIEGVEQIIGNFNNLLPFRIRVPAEAPLLPWLRDLQALQVEMRQYEFTPWSRIRNFCRWEQGVPWCHSYVVFENFPWGKAVDDFYRELRVRDGDALTQTDQPLRVEAWPSPAIEIWLGYYHRYFSHQQINAIFEDFRTLLQAMGSRPEQSLAGLLQGIEEL